MKWYRVSLCLMALACLVLGGMAGLADGAEKKIMLVVTTDTNGELNPCG